MRVRATTCALKRVPEAPEGEIKPLDYLLT